MKERPILMSAPMVHALLAGTKTQTRRVVKAKHPEWITVHPRPHPDRDGRLCYGWDGNVGEPMRCPYGQPGDRLWVRETWYCDDYRVQRGPYLKPDDMDVAEAQDDGMLVYRASSGDRPYEAEQPIWRPAIHMPRWASRITLEITEVRVERLQDISEVDALAEGVRRYSMLEQIQIGKDRWARRAYRSLWDEINGADGPGSWEANPWVWAVSFKRVEAA